MNKSGQDIVGQETLENMSTAGWYNSWLFEKIKKFLHGNILEVGCGLGNFTKELTNYGKVVAIDIDDYYVQQTKKVVADNTRVGFGNIESDKYFFNNERFDSIVCLNVLEHIEDDQKALGNMFNLLNDEGYLVLLVPAHKFLYGEMDSALNHFRRYEKKELEQLVTKIGFSTVSISRLNFLGAIGWGVSGKVLKNKVIDQSKLRIFNLIAPILLQVEKVISPPMGISLLLIARKQK